MAGYTKHTPHTDALDTLGSTITENEKRDAIHLAVENVIAGEELVAGEHIALLPDGKTAVLGETSGFKSLGIVDPFIKGSVQTGQRFWLIVYPRQISSLRHVWEHPDFLPSTDLAQPQNSRAASEAWLRDFCARSDCPEYEEVMRVAVSHMKSHHYSRYNDGKYLHFDGRDAHGEIPDEFWHHVEIVTGRECPEEYKAKYFSCGC